MSLPYVDQTLGRHEDGTFFFVAGALEIFWPLTSPCSDFRVEPDFYGFDIVETGGGCSAWSRGFRYEGRAVEMMITNDDASHELGRDARSIVVGVYCEGDCLCTWTVHKGEGEYPRTQIERHAEPAPPPPVPVPVPRTVRDSIPADWCQRIEEQCNQNDAEGDLLAWPRDSACGIEVRRIVRLADYVCGEWRDQADDVRRAALAQISVVCWG